MKRVSTFLFVLSVVALGPAIGASAAVADTSPQDDYAARMAAEHAGDSPVPSPMVQAGAGGHGLETVEVQYAILDGTPVKGFLARPATGEIKGGVIVIHEWWGLNDNIRTMAERLAAEGWAALAGRLRDRCQPQDRRGLDRLLRWRPGPLQRRSLRPFPPTQQRTGQ